MNRNQNRFLMVITELQTGCSLWGSRVEDIQYRKLRSHLLHSQKWSPHSAVDVIAQVVPCWLGSCLNHNFWLVLQNIDESKHDLSESWLRWWYTVHGVSYLFWEWRPYCSCMLIIELLGPFCQQMVFFHSKNSTVLQNSSQHSQKKMVNRCGVSTYTEILAFST